MINATTTQPAPRGGPEILKAFACYTATKSRLDAVAGAYDSWNRPSNPRLPSDRAESARLARRWEKKVDRAAQPHIEARRRLFGMILAANGHAPESETFPPCGIDLGGRLAWLSLDDPEDGLLNAELTVTRN